MGKPITKSRIEMERAFEEWRYMLDNAPQFLEPEPLSGGATVHFRPLGVVAVVSPWNFPVLLPLRAIVPALLAGNAVIFKPSELTPHVALNFSRMISKYAPLEVAIGGKELGAQVVDLPVSAIAFTGSSAVGKSIAGNAATSLKRVNLELGGLDPAIVLGDVDLARAAEEIVRNNAANSGQACNAIKRVLVHESLHDAFVARALEVAATLQYGDPRDPSTDVGPLVSAAQRDRVQGYLDDAVAKGAIAHSVTLTTTTGYFFPQTVLTNVPSSAKLLREEPFGPILPIVPFATIEDAITIANDTPYGLSASVWSKDLLSAQSVAAQLVCGVVRINAHGALGPGIPWSGCKESGIGQAKTREGLREFTHIQVVA
jgi:acyl-CoA reductase-like NAD-dependent aldehyde dehydrogenase